MEIIGNVEKDAQVRAVASGALPSGDTVIVNSDGTVSAVAGSDSSAGTATQFASNQLSKALSATFDSANNKVVIAYQDYYGNLSYGTAVVGTVSGSSISFGTPVIFNSSATEYVSITYDSSAGKVVIAYRVSPGGDQGNAIVGTVSGTSISFGSATVFNAATTDYINCTFDSNSNKVVICYRDVGAGSPFPATAIVGTVSGTSISFGSETVFQNANCIWISSVFDSSNNKVVIGYRNTASSNYGTAIVGTVSGTSISFGSAVVFNSAQSDQISAAFDTNSNKVVFAYEDHGNSAYGTAIVGTVSGTSISFGTAVVFNNTGQSDANSITFDSNSNSVVTAYRDVNNSLYGTAVVGTVSGTSISFGTPVVFSGSNDIAFYQTASTFDSNSNKAVIAFTSSATSEIGTAVVFAVGSTNLISENFLGFAAHTYADTQSALVNSTCTVDRNQTGLTAGQTYYVQSDGSLGTTAGSPSVVAGTAISSTEIIVKG